MEIFKELKKLGYKHYVDLTIEELDLLPINDIKKKIEYSLVIDWFRKKYSLHITITSQSQESWQWHIQFPHDSLNKLWEEDFYDFEEAREQAILKAIELCQKMN